MAAPDGHPISPVPLYAQIAASLRTRIEAGELGPGDRLPAIRRLAGELGVHRDTVAQAYDQLASHGLVEAEVGRGTFVRRASGSAQTAPPVRQVALSREAQELLRFEGARARFAGGDDLVALHALVPDPRLYPFDAFRRALNAVLRAGGPELLRYGGAQGHPQLRTLLARRFADTGLELGDEEVVLCHGASQGIALALRLFASAGDAVAVEEPTYANVLSTLVALGVRAEPVAHDPGPAGGGGVDLAALDAVLARPDVKAFYTIPTFHNPLGTSTGLAHRRALLEVAARHGKPVIEDAFEMDLRYEGRAEPPLAALDRSGLVVLLTSYSKSLFPGVRVGALGVRGRAAEALAALKHATDFSDSLLLQAALAELIRNGVYDRHLVRLRRELRTRRDALIEALDEHMPDGTRWTRPAGGYQLWVELPPDPFVDTRDLLADAAREGVLFAPGSDFLCDRRASSALRLTVAQADADAIRRGVAALARVVRRRRSADPAAREAARVHL